VRSRETVLVHQAAGIFQPQQHFVPGLGHGEHGADFLAQRSPAACAQVAAEVEHEYPLSPPRRRGLVLLLAPLRQLLAFGLRQQRATQAVRGVAQPRIQAGDLQTFGPARPPRCREREADEKGQRCYDSQRLGEKQAIFQQRFGHGARSFQAAGRRQC
jgi:hypothetical protein